MSTEPTLRTQLTDVAAGFRQRAAPERVATLEAATAELRASGIEQRALQPGAIAPELVMPDALGLPVALQALWRRGPLVLVFYRGGWCPYCNLALRAWQQHLPALRRLGASLVAISPQTPDASMSTAEKNELDFPVLSDSDLRAATAFGIAFEMPPALVAMYSSVGNDLPSLNGNGRWTLPLPATYVVDTGGRILWTHVETDYRERAEPSDVLLALAAAQGTGAA